MKLWYWEEKNNSYGVLLNMLVSHKTDVLGAILVFLSGYDDIVALRERIVAEEKKLTEACKFTLYTLHSNMQVRGGILRPLVCVI